MKKLIKRILWLAWKITLWFIGITALWVLAYRFIDPPVTWLMLQRYFAEDASIGKTWKDAEYISSNMLLAIVAAEDQKFFEHSGFDFESINDAVRSNRHGNRKRGASTITQQVAKNVFLWPSRSWWRKGLEAYFTVMIELLWSKSRILEVYANVVEMGDGIYGAEAAAQKLYSKPALLLTGAESAMIAAVLPNPRKYSPLHPTNYLLQRQQWILRQMKNLSGPEFPIQAH